MDINTDRKTNMSDGLKILFCLGYDQYPGYPYIDETPTDPDRYFGYNQEHQEHQEYQEESSHHRQSVVLSGECKYGFLTMECNEIMSHKLSCIQGV